MIRHWDYHNGTITQEDNDNELELLIVGQWSNYQDEAKKDTTQFKKDVQKQKNEDVLKKYYTPTKALKIL